MPLLEVYLEIGKVQDSKGKYGCCEIFVFKIVIKFRTNSDMSSSSKLWIKGPK